MTYLMDKRLQLFESNDAISVWERMCMSRETGEYEHASWTMATTTTRLQKRDEQLERVYRTCETYCQ